MKYLRLLFTGLLFGLGASALIRVVSANPENCNTPYRHDSTVYVNNKIIAAEVVKSPIEKEKGLSSRSCIGDNQAMLFEFDELGDYPFWMKDMKFPIDILWLDAQREIVTVKSNVSPQSYPKTFSNSKPAQYVLELQAGRANELGIKEGAKLNF